MQDTNERRRDIIARKKKEGRVSVFWLRLVVDECARSVEEEKRRW